MFEAVDRTLGATVAIKLLHEHLADQVLVRERFRREVAIARTLQHRGIVRVHELYEDGGRIFFSMERRAGLDLKEHVRVHGALNAAARRDVVEQIGSALAAAHDAGVVHRDIKPHNVFLAPDGRVTVLDFGLARVETFAGLTATSVVLGTPEYLAPEALGRLPVDGRADLYSLGVLWFELATGGLPFGRATHLEVLRRAADEDGPAPEGDDVDSHEAACIQALLRREPDERPESAGALLRRLRSPAAVVERPALSCRTCGGRQEAAEFCWSCGSWLHGDARGGSLLVLLHGDGQDLEAKLAPFGVWPRDDVDAEVALARRPSAVLADLNPGFGRLLQRELLAAGLTTELRDRADVGLDLMGGGQLPGSVFGLGILGGWAAICGGAATLAGVPGLIVALASGPPIAKWILREGHRFVLPAFALAAGPEQTDPLADRYRAFLDSVQDAACRRLGAKLLRAASRVRAAVAQTELGAASLRRVLGQTVGEGLDALEALEPVEQLLAEADPRELVEAFESARARGGADLGARRDAVERLEELGRRREARVQHILSLVDRLDALRIDLIEEGSVDVDLGIAEAALAAESEALLGARRELRALLGPAG